MLLVGFIHKMSTSLGDKPIRWDSKFLVNMSYDQLVEVIESLANIAEVLVKSQIRTVSKGYFMTRFQLSREILFLWSFLS